ncbi:MAG: hypothetical protein WAO23_00930 [Dethiobacteria bacterium]
MLWIKEKTGAVVEPEYGVKMYGRPTRICGAGKRGSHIDDIMTSNFSAEKAAAKKQTE